MFVEGMYDLLIDLQLYPYLDARKEYVHTATVQDLVEKNHATINLDEPNTVGGLYVKLEDIASMGYGEDGGFPILSNKDDRVLEGYIATSELTHALDQLCRHFESSPYPMSEQELLDIPCYFRQVGGADDEHEEGRGVDPVRAALLMSSSEICDERHANSHLLNDFSAYVDQVPCSSSSGPCGSGSAHVHVFCLHRLHSRLTKTHPWSYSWKCSLNWALDTYASPIQVANTLALFTSALCLHTSKS